MDNGTKNIIAACILVVGLIITIIIYAYSTRYVIDTSGYIRRIDKWKNTYEWTEAKK